MPTVTTAERQVSVTGILEEKSVLDTINKDMFAHFELVRDLTKQSRVYECVDVKSK
jgi:hypothetical protein